MTTSRYAPIFEQGPLEQRGEPRQPGHFYFARDEHQGVLYLSFDGDAWTKLARGLDEPLAEEQKPRLLRLDAGQAFAVVDEAGDPLFGVDAEGTVHLPGAVAGTLALDPAALPARPATVAQIVQVLVRAGLCA